MIDKVLKRNDTVATFDETKITQAIYSVMEEIESPDWNKAIELTQEIVEQLESILEEQETPIIPSVGYIDDCVEEVLMNSDHGLAKAYILFRDAKDKALKPDIFRPRKEYRPYEYPHMIEYIDAIHQSFWTHKSFNLDSSVQDIKVNMPKHHEYATIRSILSVASVEAKLKSFWSKLGDRLPMAEFEELGTTIGSNEVYHAHFYAKVIEMLGMNELFKEVLEIPVMKRRIQYMTKALEGRNGTNQEYIKSLIFFSLFVENVSLFSQFLTISVFNKELNQVSGLAQGISATAIEENLHATVGADIVNLARQQYPEWFTETLNDEVRDMVVECFESECCIIDWIYEYGELEFLPKSAVIEYIKMRTNKGLEMAGFDKHFVINDKLIETVEWFDIQTKTTIHRDFFAGHSVNYNKNSASYTEDDLF